MGHGQFREIRLRNFRCFGEPQTARLAPLTLLVGENSTGKTSFLAAVRAVWDAAHGNRSPDFRKAPYDLGAFPEIVYRRGGRGSTPDSFAIGFRELVSGNRLLDFEVTFESRDAAPAPATTSWESGAASVEYCGSGENPRIVFKSPGGSWCHAVSDEDRTFEFEEPWITGFFSRLHLAAKKNDPSSLAGYWKALPEGSERSPRSEDLADFSFLGGMFTRVPSQGPPLPALRYTQVREEPTTPRNWMTTPGAPTFLLASQVLSFEARPSGRRSRKSWMRLAASPDCSTTFR